jgi:hypothetical protein
MDASIAGPLAELSLGLSLAETGAPRYQRQQETRRRSSLNQMPSRTIVNNYALARRQYPVLRPSRQLLR